jgi:hypothetical protein
MCETMFPCLPCVIDRPWTGYIRLYPPGVSLCPPDTSLTRDAQQGQRASIASALPRPPSWWRLGVTRAAAALLHA